MVKKLPRKNKIIHYHTYDLPDSVKLVGNLAIDTETKGLNLIRDRLCCVQIADENENIHIVHYPTAQYKSPNLIELLQESNRTKIFHYARFDLAILRREFRVFLTPVFCTKIASRLIRTYTNRHGLAELCQDLLGFSLDKSQQTTDWGVENLTESQLEYAANDVRFLHALMNRLNELLSKENRLAIASACFAFLPVRAEMDLIGWGDEDIFSHSHKTS